MIDRSRKHRLNASCQCCRLGEARPFRGAVFLRIRAADRAGSPSESSIRFVSWSFRPQAASGGRGASPPVPRPAGCRRRRRLRRLDCYFIIFRSASASFRPQLASGGRGASPPDPRPGAGADGGSAALQFRSTMIDRSREPLSKCEPTLSSVSLQARDCFDFIPQRRGEFRGG